MAAISNRVAQEGEVLVLSGTAHSASVASAGTPEVVEVRNWMPGKVALAKRALAELLFTVRMLATLLVKLQRGDVALTVPAPFMLPYAFTTAAKLKGAKSVLIVHDLYPDVLIMAGMLKPQSMLAKVMRALNALMFRALDALVRPRYREAAVALSRNDPRQDPLYPELGDARARRSRDRRRQSLSPSACRPLRRGSVRQSRFHA
jgi:hypothetical protein